MILDDGYRKWCFDGVTVWSWVGDDVKYPITFTQGDSAGFSSKAWTMMLGWLEEVASAEYLDWLSE